MAWIASTLALTVTLVMATMEASMASTRSKEETTEKGDRVGLKRKCQNGRRCHGSTVALMLASMVDTMVASMASVASIATMASMVASRTLVVAVIVPLEWLNLKVAEPKRDDERAGGLTLRYEGVLTVAGDCVYGSDDSTDDFDGTDSFVGFDGGFDGSAGGLADFDGFDGDVVSVAETDDRAKNRWKTR